MTDHAHALLRLAQAAIPELLDRLEAAEKELDALQVEKVFDAIYRVWYEAGLDIRGADISAFITNVRTEMEK